MVMLRRCRLHQRRVLLNDKLGNIQIGRRDVAGSGPEHRIDLKLFPLGTKLYYKTELLRPDSYPISTTPQQPTLAHFFPSLTQILTTNNNTQPNRITTLLSSSRIILIIIVVRFKSKARQACKNHQSIIRGKARSETLALWCSPLPCTCLCGFCPNRSTEDLAGFWTRNMVKLARLGRFRSALVSRCFWYRWDPR